MLLDCLFVGCGGMVGSFCRYLLGLVPFATVGGFPLMTMIINFVGFFHRIFHPAIGSVIIGTAAALFKSGTLRRLHHLFHLFAGDAATV